MNIVHIQGLNFSYRKRVIFHQAGLEIPAGSITGIIGANGTGKTTFFDILCGLRATVSEVFDNRARSVSYLSQIITLPASMRMHEAYRFVACLNADRVRSRDEISAMLEQISPRLAIRYMDIWAKPAGVCSYGEIRSFLALSLLTSGSDLFILDEPTAGVDPEFQYYLWQAVRHACALGATVVFSSHQITEVAEHCDGFYLLHNRTFQRFEQANDFMAVHQANSLSEAFMNALNAVEH